MIFLLFVNFAKSMSTLDVKLSHKYAANGEFYFLYLRRNLGLHTARVHTACRMAVIPIF
jgi:hypothetical protein